jgi:hypothetical protein
MKAKLNNALSAEAIEKAMANDAVDAEHSNSIDKAGGMLRDLQAVEDFCSTAASDDTKVTFFIKVAVKALKVFRSRCSQCACFEKVVFDRVRVVQRRFPFTHARDLEPRQSLQG